MPALPASIDKAPEPIKPLADKSMGTLATARVELVEQYGVLGVRFNTLREFYGCVRKQINDHKTVDGCL